MKKTLNIANIVSLIIAVTINYISNTSMSGGESIGAISARYENILTPAGYAFAIWGLIYLLLFAFAIYQGIGLFKKHPSDEIVMKIKWWFVVANLANAGWVLAFSQDLVGVSVLIILTLLISLLKIVLNLDMEKPDAPLSTIVWVWWPFSIYFGWVTVAVVANIATYLTKVGYDGAPLSPALWAIILLFIVAGICVALIWSRNMREYALTAVWGVVAIAVKNWDAHPLVAYIAVGLAVVIFINVAIHGHKNRHAFINQLK